MGNIVAMLEGWTITSVETIENYSRTDDTLLNIMDEIKNVSLSNSEEQSDVTGKSGNVLFTLKKNKAVQGSGSSGYISGSLVSLQTGDEVKSGLMKFRKRETIKFGADSTTVKLAETAAGTAGSEIMSMIVTIDGEETSTKYSQGTTAGADKFSYASGTITMPTATNSKSGVVEVVYEYEKSGASVGNRSDTYGKTTHTFINCLGKNSCDEVYFIQIEIYRADWDSNFAFELGGDGTEHPFSFKSLPDKCSGDSRFWDMKVYKTA